MAGHEGSGSPTPSEQENHDDKNDDNNIQDGEQEAQENDEVNESSVQDIVREASVAGEINAEMAQPAQARSSSDIIMEDPNAGPDLEELGGVIIGEIENANGLVELLVMSVDSSPGTPEIM